jgi:hypothetical protein
MTQVLEIYSEQECLSNPDKLYVFGENERQQGSKSKGGGQAIIRPFENAFGFCTLEEIGKPWVDLNFSQNCMRIEMDITTLKTRAKRYNSVVFPKYGIGTGRAGMIQSCPRTFLYLCNRLLEEFKFNNIAELSVPKF